jgi:AcrR family transcriptional regulator
MPRPQREALILEVAGQVFARGGYHDASMDAIAEMAGVSKPMLYAYFGSKEGLYVAYIDGTGRELLERLERPDREGEGPVGRLRARINEFLAFVEEYRDGWRVLFREAASSGPLADEVAALRGQIVATVRRLLDGEAVVRRNLPPPATDALAHAIVGAGESLANWWLARSDVRREEVVEWYTGLVQAAIAAALVPQPGTRSAGRPSGSPAARRA